MIWRWLLAVFLLLLTAGFAMTSVVNFWAGSGPPSPHPEVYMRWGYVYGVASIVSFAGFVGLSIGNILKRKRK